MSRHDLGWLLVCAGCILIGVQLVPHLSSGGAALLALAIDGTIAWVFGRPG